MFTDSLKKPSTECFITRKPSEIIVPPEGQLKNLQPSDSDHCVLHESGINKVHYVQTTMQLTTIPNNQSLITNIPNRQSLPITDVPENNVSNLYCFTCDMQLYMQPLSP